MNNSTRKIYVKPELMVVAIDQEITLVMTSLPGGGGTPIEPLGAPASPASTIFPSATGSTQESVFGTGTPVYREE